MKERFLLAASWGVFIWTVAFCVYSPFSAIDRINYGVPLRPDEWEQYMWVFLFTTPVFWLTLWIVTGKSRILPWRK